MNDFLSDTIDKEKKLSENTRCLLTRARIRTFKGLACMKMGTFLKKVPSITTRALYCIEESLDERGLSFVEDDTISSFNDSSISQRTLHMLWSKGIIKYKDFNKFHYWKIVRILGKTVFRSFRRVGVCSWMGERNIVPSSRYPFLHAGFTEKTLDILMSHKKNTFEDIISMTEFELACFFAGYDKKDKWPPCNSLAMARLREVKYILWKNKMPKMKSMNLQKQK